MLSLSKASIQELVHRGLLREVQMGRRSLIHRDELERLAREGVREIWPSGPDGRSFRARRPRQVA